MPAPAAPPLRHGRQNLAILLAQTAACLGLIQALHLPMAWPWKALVLMVFCIVMQGTFSMMHEACHGNGHPHRRLNALVGVWAATLFGSAYTLIRVNHEGHHVRNRTPAELAEYILPGESRLTKTALYYFAVLGGIWLGSFAATLLLPFVPFRFAKALAVRWQSMDGYNRSFAEFSARDWWALRLESILFVAFWIGVVWLFDWRWPVLALAYAAFAFSYSSLQWIYHLRTPLDRVEGAYDLRAPWFIRWPFLNFNYNLSHHRYPRAPWQELHARAIAHETQPLWRRWIGVLRPPEPFPARPDLLTKVYF
ncbi:fatty acid desaturase family protein [Ottowia testudinis]|uniref:Fatty acid desaturase n=1 Tax=Ottowia testudinis TaxID=2816950 RepID=A0A975H3Y4_9BURK|nr:fatty acid desaturase [Ottowia testudinis]QTD45780.1 fatty acid desaturase [Ottowia testudinis]